MARDIQIALYLYRNPDYEHVPVDIVTFIDSPNYLNLMGSCWETIKQELKLFYEGNYREAVFDKAIGAGKSFESSIIATYEVYRMLCLRDPQKHFGLAPKSKIAFMNMSIRASQARDVVFGDVLNRITDSPWFNRYGGMNRKKRSVIELAKSVYIIPGNSKETFPAGYNIFSAIIDEAAWYIEKQGLSTAEDIHNNMDRRIRSRFGEFGKIITISNPRYEGDFIEKKMKEAEKDPLIFSSRKTLWDMKVSLQKLPKVSVKIGTTGYRIPRMFHLDFRKNPEKFARDFMAIPSMVLEPYFKDFKAIEESYTKERIRNIWKQGYLLTDENDRYGGSCFIHVDLALNKDAAGLAMVEKYRGNYIAVCLAQIKASKERGEIDFGEIRDMIYLLKRKGYRIQKVSMDGWQSVDSIQMLTKKGFDAEVLSVDRDLRAYDTMKGLFYDGRLLIPKFEPLLHELQRLELINGKKVDHPKNGSKDVADALAGACYWAAGTESYDPQIWNSQTKPALAMSGRVVPRRDEILISN